MQIKDELKEVFRVVASEIPDPKDWIHYLKPSIDKNWYTNFGPVNEDFEERIKNKYCEKNEVAITASSATSALSACLISESISGEVLCPGFTFQATASSILGANCNPIIIDVDKNSGIVTPQILKEGFLNTKAKAAILLAPYGISVDFHEHEKICHEMGKILIIDNAAGLGIKRESKFFSGSYENVIEVFSLHATKPFGIGEGGLIIAPSSKEFSIRSAMNFGLQTHANTGSTSSPFWGINGKMSEFHAAIGLAVLETIDKRIFQRQEMAKKWIDNLTNIDLNLNIFTHEIENSPWQIFPVILESEKIVEKVLKIALKNKYELRRYYYPSLGNCHGMKSIGICENSNNLSARVLTLPIRSWIKKNDQENLITSIMDILKEGYG